MVKSLYITFNKRTFNTNYFNNIDNGLILDIKEFLYLLLLEDTIIVKLTNLNRGRLLEDYIDNISIDLNYYYKEEALIKLLV